MKKEKEMKQRTLDTAASSTRLARLALAVFCTFGMLSQAAPQAGQNAAPSKQRAFNSADEAARALVDASEKYDVPALLEILGPDAKDLVVSEDWSLTKTVRLPLLD
jgi:hypothetical protein